MLKVRKDQRKGGRTEREGKGERRRKGERSKKKGIEGTEGEMICRYKLITVKETKI